MIAVLNQFIPHHRPADFANNSMLWLLYIKLVVLPFPLFFFSSYLLSWSYNLRQMPKFILETIDFIPSISIYHIYYLQDLVQHLFSESISTWSTMKISCNIDCNCQPSPVIPSMSWHIPQPAVTLISPLLSMASSTSRSWEYKTIFRGIIHISL